MLLLSPETLELVQGKNFVLVRARDDSFYIWEKTYGS